MYLCTDFFLAGTSISYSEEKEREAKTEWEQQTEEEQKERERASEILESKTSVTKFKWLKIHRGNAEDRRVCSRGSKQFGCYVHDFGFGIKQCHPKLLNEYPIFVININLFAVISFVQSLIQFGCIESNALFENWIKRSLVDLSG